MSETLQDKNLEQIRKLLEKAVAGNVSERLVLFDQESDLNVLVEPINNLLDRVECILREMTSVFQAGTEKRFHRKFITSGLTGVFLQVAKRGNENLEQVELMDNAKIGLADSFNIVIGKSTGDIQDKIQTVQNVNADLASKASEMINRAEQGEERGEDTSFRVQSVATAAEELSASIAEISMQTEKTNNNANEAIGKLGHALDTVTEIDNSAEDVSSIVGLINDVARQTNLLALNAAIEAARAGEAGRGFGVVASEVKELANQTRRATRDIVEKIDKMKEATTAGVVAMKGVEESLTTITELFGGISSAVQEQSSVTQEIAKNAEEAAISTSGLQQDLKRISEQARASGESIKETICHGEELGHMSKDLEKSSQEFISQILA